MKGVVDLRSPFVGYPIRLYGKTGTAEESEDRPDHALFIGYTEDDSKPDLAFAVRIAYGYSSDNVIMVTRDLMNYYYGLAEESTIITGYAATEGLTSKVTD